MSFPDDEGLSKGPDSRPEPDQASDPTGGLPARPAGRGASGPWGETNRARRHEPSDQEVRERFAELVADLHDPRRSDTVIWRGGEPHDLEDDEHFEPAPPQPLPRDDWTFWGALAGLVLGPVWLIYLVFAHPGGDRVWRWAAGGLMLTGFMLLILRSPTQRDSDDDGARV